jgi:hypothetical protein
MSGYIALHYTSLKKQNKRCISAKRNVFNEKKKIEIKH